MEIIALNKFIGNCDHRCGWVVLYGYKPATGKSCSTDNAKMAFEKILKFVEYSNVIVNEHNKTIFGNPPRYRVEYNVASCVCSKVDFDVRM